MKVVPPYFLGRISAPLYYIIMHIWDDKYMACLFSIIICYLVCTYVLVYAPLYYIIMYIWDDKYMA